MVVALENELEIDETETLDDDESQNVRYEIAAYPTDFTLEVLHGKWKKGQVVMQDFQRAYVWTLPQASRFIESFLLGLPIPQVFLYRSFSNSKLIVVDGHQRLATIAKYFEGEFSDTQPFKLRGVSEKWNGSAYEDLNETDQDHLRDCTLRSIVVRQIQPDDDSSIYQIFERLNTGGTQLNAMEIRKAIFHGDGYKLLERLNEDSNWRSLVGKDLPDRRLRDVELVLRVLSLASNKDAYTKPMKTFLTNYMGVISGENLDRHDLGDRFRTACQIVHDKLGERPFHLRNNRLNVAALDAVIATAIQLLEYLEQDLRSHYRELCSNTEFTDVITDSTSDTTVVKARLDLARDHLVRSAE